MTKNMKPAKLAAVKALTLDVLNQDINAVKTLQAKRKAIETQIDALKEGIKGAMKARDLVSHTTPEGVSARFAEQNRLEIDKDLAKTILGPRWAEVTSFKLLTTFTVA